MVCFGDTGADRGRHGRVVAQNNQVVFQDASIEGAVAANEGANPADSSQSTESEGKRVVDLGTTTRGGDVSGEVVIEIEGKEFYQKVMVN